MCPTHQRPSASLGTPTTELSLPTRWDSSYGTHNAPHVPLDTVIWTASLPCLRWVANPGPPFQPAPAPSNLQAPKVAVPLEFAPQCHESTWSTWWELTRQSASNTPAVLNKESLESRCTGQTASGSWRSPSIAHLRPSTSTS